MCARTIIAADSALIRPAVSDDLGQIKDILNYEIMTSTVSWTSTPKSFEQMLSWFNDRRDAGFPILVAIIDDQVAGYASYGPFRAGEGYASTVEHTVYVKHDYRRQGLARLLIERLFEIARSLGLRRMVGGVSSGAEGSYELHLRLGFEDCGRLPGIGQKFGQDLDLIFMVYRLDQTNRV